LELSAEEEHAYLAAFDDRDGFVKRYTSKHYSAEHAEIAYTWFRASKPLFTLPLHTGLRRGDLLNLTWDRVDLKNRTLKVITKKTSTPVLLPLSETALRALQVCRSRKLSSTLWVFTQRDGAQFSVTTMRRHHVVAKKLAGITRRFRIHDLRHSYACKLSSAGLSLQIISKVLSHASTRMCERYARPDSETMRQIAAAAER
jgi:integrase